MSPSFVIGTGKKYLLFFVFDQWLRHNFVKCQKPLTIWLYELVYWKGRIIVIMAIIPYLAISFSLPLGQVGATSPQAASATSSSAASVLLPCRGRTSSPRGCKNRARGRARELAAPPPPSHRCWPALDATHEYLSTDDQTYAVAVLCADCGIFVKACCLADSPRGWNGTTESTGDSDPPAPDWCASPSAPGAAATRKPWRRCPAHYPPHPSESICRAI